MLPALMLPALPFTILMPALSLLLVFRTKPLPQKQGPCGRPAQPECGMLTDWTYR